MTQKSEQIAKQVALKAAVRLTKDKLKPDGIVGNMTYAKLIEVNRRKMSKGKGKYNIE